MNKHVKVSGVAKGQWNSLCNKKEEDLTKLEYKIRRAYNLGNVTHLYANGEFIIRYYDLNLLVSNGVILTIWRDSSRPKFEVSEAVKEVYSNVIPQTYGEEYKAKIVKLKSANYHIQKAINLINNTKTLIEYAKQEEAV